MNVADELRSQLASLGPLTSVVGSGASVKLDVFVDESGVVKTVAKVSVGAYESVHPDLLVAIGAMRVRLRARAVDAITECEEVIREMRDTLAKDDARANPGPTVEPQPLATDTR